MEAKHTPGPWRTGSRSGAVFAGNKLVASIYGDDENCTPDDRMWANARLIAAAPELLEALQAVVRVADRATVEFDMARAAIAKATQ